MRASLVRTLVDLAAADSRVFLLTADLGWSVVEPFAAAYPTRFLNIGVAEANMAGVAAGLALVGYTPFIYSIATFTSMRCYEQVAQWSRASPAPRSGRRHRRWFSYGHAGPTHHALEDLAICRTQPGLTVLAPADPEQTVAAVRLTQTLPGPVYLRVGKGGDPAVPGLDGRLRLDCPEVVRDGTVVLLLATGSIIHEALQAARLLEGRGISTAAAVMAHLPFVARPRLGRHSGALPRGRDGRRRLHRRGLGIARCGSDRPTRAPMPAVRMRGPRVLHYRVREPGVVPPALWTRRGLAGRRGGHSGDGGGS